MLNVVVMVSGGGTNLQAIIDNIESGQIRNARIAAVISNNANAYALERAKKHGIPAVCISPKDFSSRQEFNEAFLEKVERSDRISLYWQVSSCDTAGNDPTVSESDHQYPSVLNPFILRNRILWAEGT